MSVNPLFKNQGKGSPRARKTVQFQDQQNTSVSALSMRNDDVVSLDRTQELNNQVDSLRKEMQTKMQIENLEIEELKEKKM